MSFIDEILPTEILIMIVEQDGNSFVAIRSISRSIWNYTNEYMHRYKHKSLILFEGEDFAGLRIVYWKLPNGSKHGTYLRLHNNGSLRTECEFIDGKREGIFRSYHDNGRVDEECQYKNGQYHGLSKLFDENGPLYFQCEYKNGMMDGSYWNTPGMFFIHQWKERRNM